MNFKYLFLSTLLLSAGISISAQNLNFESNLPLVFIDTGNRQIPDEPKLNATMGIVWNGTGKKNSTSDNFNHYEGRIGIELRGSSSQSFPKKSYGFETRDWDNQDADVPLLGMPEEEDWILYAPYSDKSLIRNSLIFSLAAQFGVYTPRTRQVELFLNNRYQGVYVLMEKIKRDKHRVDISKLTETDVEGEALTGGYIIKIDKTTGNSGEGWWSDYKNVNQSKTYYQFHYPKHDEIRSVQKRYIQNYVSKMETAIKNKDFSAETGYPAFIEVESFFDFILLNELAKNIDGYRLSTFLYKDKNEKMRAGPIWDFNLAFGNANYNGGERTSGLQIYADLPHDNWANPFWWSGLMADNHFSNGLKCRWQALRDNQLSNQRIEFVSDSLVSEMDDAVERNFARWPVLGKQVWPNYFVGSTHAEEITWMKNWIRARLVWLDAVFSGECTNSATAWQQEFKVEVQSNRFTSELVFQIAADASAPLQFQLFSINGTLLENQTIFVHQGPQAAKINVQYLRPGMYLYRIMKEGNKIASGKVVKVQQ